jgi:hypothetical protein
MEKGGTTGVLIGSTQTSHSTTSLPFCWSSESQCLSRFRRKGKELHCLCLHNGRNFVCLFVSFYSAGIEPRALHMLGKYSTTELHPQFFVFETVSLCSPAWILHILPPPPECQDYRYAYHFQPLKSVNSSSSKTCVNKQYNFLQSIFNWHSLNFNISLFNQQNIDKYNELVSEKAKQ